MVRRLFGAAALATLMLALPAKAGTLYWSIFNAEDDSVTPATVVTYNSLDDMLTGANPQHSFTPGVLDVRKHLVGSGSDGSAFWGVYNYEGNADMSAAFITYDSFADFIHNENRTGKFIPDGQATVDDPNGRADDLVDAGSDGTRYWSLFNSEDNDVDAATYVLYATLEDMLNDENPVNEAQADGVANSSGRPYGRHIVGTGSDGDTFWSLFNWEADDDLISIYVTYATLEDMFNDENRVLELKVPGLAGVDDRVGTGGGGAFPTVVPLPATLPLALAAFAGLGLMGARRRKAA